MLQVERALRPVPANSIGHRGGEGVRLLNWKQRIDALQQLLALPSLEDQLDVTIVQCDRRKLQLATRRLSDDAVPVAIDQQVSRRYQRQPSGLLGRSRRRSRTIVSRTANVSASRSAATSGSSTRRARNARTTAWCLRKNSPKHSDSPLLAARNGSRSSRAIESVYPLHERGAPSVTGFAHYHPREHTAAAPLRRPHGAFSVVGLASIARGELVIPRRSGTVPAWG
jgi:hypothetical protein